MTDEKQFNPYETLGVERNATDEEIRQAFRRKVSEVHPDRQKGKSTADSNIETAELIRARDLLLDPAQRAEFDETGRVESKRDLEGLSAELLLGTYSKVISEAVAQLQSLDDECKRYGETRTPKGKLQLQKVYLEKKRNLRSQIKPRIKALVERFAKDLTMSIENNNASARSLTFLRSALISVLTPQTELDEMNEQNIFISKIESDLERIKEANHQMKQQLEVVEFAKLKVDQYRTGQNLEPDIVVEDDEPTTVKPKTPRLLGTACTTSTTG